jgi:hypothetical protein
MPSDKLPRCNARTDPRVRGDAIRACRRPHCRPHRLIGDLAPALPDPHRAPALALAIDPPGTADQSAPGHAPERRRQLHPSRRDPAMRDRDQRDRLQHPSGGHCPRRLALRCRERHARIKRDVARPAAYHGRRPPRPQRRSSLLGNAGAMAHAGHAHSDGHPAKRRVLKSNVVDANLHGDRLLPVTCQ